MLRDLVGLGLWRLDTQGYYAALELQGAVEVMQLAAGRGQMLPAQLRLEQRMQKRPGEQTKRYAVPVLDVEISPAQLLGTSATVTYEQRELPQPPLSNGHDAELTKLTRVPDAVPQWPTSSIAEQAGAMTSTSKPKRKGAAKAAPPTKLAPRTAAQAREDSRAAATIVDEPVRPNMSDIGAENARMIDEQPEDEAQAAQLGPPDDDDSTRMITAAQLKKLSILLREAGFDDRETRHAFVATAINRSVDSAKDLTLDEASTVIDILENDQPPKRDDS
jgi:hypothetical protein